MEMAELPDTMKVVDRHDSMNCPLRYDPVFLPPGVHNPTLVLAQKGAIQ